MISKINELNKHLASAYMHRIPQKRKNWAFILSYFWRAVTYFGLVFMGLVASLSCKI